MINLPMTAVGHAALEHELRQRIAVERPRLIQRIQEAIADDITSLKTPSIRLPR
jgi:transcription elongation factor GreA